MIFRVKRHYTKEGNVLHANFKKPRIHIMRAWILLLAVFWFILLAPAIITYFGVSL